MDTKNQQNYFNNPVVIVLVLVVIGLGGYLLLSRSSDVSGNKVSDLSNIPTTPNINTNTQTPVIESKPTPQAKQNTDTKKVATTEESRYCAQQSKAKYDREVALTTQNGLYPIKGAWSYTNHLNVKEGKCFMVETLYGESGAAYAGNSEGLYDVYENTNIANYYHNEPYKDTCSINGVYGCTKTQFSAFVNLKMESTTY